MNGDFLVIGHRGFSFDYPENTILGISKSYEHGANGAEVDVKVTSDKEFVLMHDHTVNRTTNGTGRVDSLSLSEIKNLDAGSWKDQQFAGRSDTKVPTLEEAFDLIRNKDVFLFLHTNTSAFNQTDTERLLDYINQSGLKEKIVILGESLSVFMREYDSEIKTFQWGASTNEQNIGERLTNAVQFNFTPFGVGKNVTSNMISTIKRYNLPVLVSFISSNFKAETDRLLDLGVDMFYTDNVTETVSSFNERNIQQIKPSTYMWRNVEIDNSVKLSTFIKSESAITKVSGFINNDGVIRKVTVFGGV